MDIYIHLYIFIYWVDQNVRLGWKNPNEHFGQPNTLLFDNKNNRSLRLLCGECEWTKRVKGIQQAGYCSELSEALMKTAWSNSNGGQGKWLKSRFNLEQEPTRNWI